MQKCPTRKLAFLFAVLALMAAPLAVSGCEESLRREFRSVAGDAVQTGVNSILSGLVDGLFAIIDTTDNGNTSTGNPTSTETQ